MMLYPILKDLEISQGVVTGGLYSRWHHFSLYILSSLPRLLPAAVTAITRQLYPCGLIYTGSTIIVQYNVPIIATY